MEDGGASRPSTAGNYTFSGKKTPKVNLQLGKNLCVTRNSWRRNLGATGGEETPESRSPSRTIRSGGKQECPEQSAQTMRFAAVRIPLGRISDVAIT